MKKVLFVLCLALLLTLVCSSAFALDRKYTSGGVVLDDLKLYNDETITLKEIVKEPSCTVGTIRITTAYEKDGVTKLKDYNGNDTTHIYELKIDPIHNVVLKTLDGKEASCEENGIAKYVCKDCNAVDPYGQGEIALSAQGHDFSKVVVDITPSCSDMTPGGTAGKIHNACSRCGKPETNADGSVKYTIIPYATTDANLKQYTHKFTAGAIEVEKVRTCKEGGLRYVKCSICGNPEKNADGTIKYDAAYKNPAEHTFGDWVIVTPASCIDGLKTRYCSVCNFAENAVIPGTGVHVWEYIMISVNGCEKAADGVSAAPATKTVANINAKKRCTLCNKEENMTVEEKNTQFANYYKHHNFVVDPNGSSRPAGCVNGLDGYQDMICNKCQGKYRQTIARKTSHNFGEWKLVVTPGTDGTQNGVWERQCTNYGCLDKETYVGKTAPSGAAPVATATANATTAPTTAPTGAPSGSENYQVTSWSFNGSGVSGQVKGNVTYRTPGLGVNVIIYTPTGTFLATSTPVNDDGTFSVSAGGAVYAVSIQLKDNNKTYQTDGKYV